VSDNGDTVKFLWELEGASRVETVLMLYADRATVCVSSQAGCAMACGFCATGQAGFTRHLTVGEIVEQVVRASQRARQLGAPGQQHRLHGHGRADGQSRCGVDGDRAVPR
jgi:23S rRNA (adenine2503-C2)-methyltransferase